MMLYNTPRLPRALLHPLTAVQRTFERDSMRGGQSRPVDTVIATFQGVVMPLSNEDWKRLPEGTYTETDQKLYTDDASGLKPGYIVVDSYDGQRYTVKTELDHNSIHPMRRYLVEGVEK